MAVADEPTRPEDLAVLAAIALLTEELWPLEQIAVALQRCPKWLQAEIDKTLMADAHDAGPRH